MLSTRQDRVRFPMARFTVREIDIETAAPAYFYFLFSWQKVVKCNDRYETRLSGIKKLLSFCQADGRGPKQGCVCFVS